MSKKRKTKTERELASEYLDNTTPDTELSSGERDDQPEEVAKNRVREAMEQANKHTPGPWAFQEGDRERRSSSLIHKAGDPEFYIGFVTCEWFNAKQREEDLANARLIAASPSLLVGLQLAVHHLENPGIPITPASLENLRTMIASAKGLTS